VATSSVDVERLRHGMSLGLHMIGPCALHVWKWLQVYLRNLRILHKKYFYDDMANM
jgi:hypothetical protein